MWKLQLWTKISLSTHPQRFYFKNLIQRTQVNNNVLFKMLWTCSFGLRSDGLESDLQSKSGENWTQNWMSVSSVQPLVCVWDTVTHTTEQSDSVSSWQRHKGWSRGIFWRDDQSLSESVRMERWAASGLLPVPKQTRTEEEEMEDCGPQSQMSRPPARSAICFICPGIFKPTETNDTSQEIQDFVIKLLTFLHVCLALIHILVTFM